MKYHRTLNHILDASNLTNQYTVKTDARSGIISDPNRYSDDAQYIVRLVGQVVKVSVETMRIVKGL